VHPPPRSANTVGALQVSLKKGGLQGVVSETGEHEDNPLTPFIKGESEAPFPFHQRSTRSRGYIHSPTQNGGAQPLRLRSASTIRRHSRHARSVSLKKGGPQGVVSETGEHEDNPLTPFIKGESGAKTAARNHSAIEVHPPSADTVGTRDSSPLKKGTTGGCQ
jgi:uncharacterized protein YodC (DUF2158 family)